MGSLSRPGVARRGVTLVEMLVTVAVLVIIMTVMVQIFQSATGALTVAQTIQDLDNRLKLLDATIRSDLGGVTARFTPPLDPAQNLGYFEYGENEFADIQGEDSDDYLRFTAKAPPGQPFTGRLFLPPMPNANRSAAQLATYLQNQPVTVTSEFAEIIYFLRNGNLYRRVLLVAPELQSSILQSVNNVGSLGAGISFAPGALGQAHVSWRGVNDLSARPASTGNTGQPILLNTLGTLTNRENRFPSPRFGDDFADISGTVATPDGLADDLNADNVPDYYPTLYPGVFNPVNANAVLIFEPPYPNNVPAFRNLSGFPWVFPGAYSRAQSLPNATASAGWIHAPGPVANIAGTGVAFDSAPQLNGNNQPVSGPLAYLQNINHNPLDLGDNLPTSSLPAMFQTWWGFPTWRETLSPLWNDPTVQVNVSHGQPNGLMLLTTPASAADPAQGDVAQGFLSPDRAVLPAMSALWRANPQLFSDNFGDPTNSGTSPFFPSINPLWSPLSWEDELIMTNVRSFDVKAYDNALAAYADLGWGDDFRIPQQFTDPNYGNAAFAQAPYLSGNYDEFSGSYVTPAVKTVNGQGWDLLTQTFAHEGRMPPLLADGRFDSQFGAAAIGPNNPNGYLSANSPFLAANNGPYNNGNVGDDSPRVVRLRRVWDSWSTAYSQAPGTGVGANGFPVGPPFTPPIYPSYPPPYPAPLRGIQIQIRVADPTNQRIKSLTIRQDFTDKL
jgi:prepilin-type N-terminal cleavage/methylation domain-containing protein